MASKAQRGFHAGFDVGDEQGVEIECGELLHLLPHNSRTECIRASDLEHVCTSSQQLGDEFIARESEGEPFRIVVPRIVCHQAETFQALLLSLFDHALVLWFFGLAHPVIPPSRRE